VTAEGQRRGTGDETKRAAPRLARPATPADDASAPIEVADYLVHLRKERDVSPNTLGAYERDLRDFVTFLRGYYGGADWSWQGVDRLAMRAFLGYLTRRGLAKRSVARAVSGVRGFYRFLHRNELVEATPARAVASPRLEKYLPSYLDRAQIETVLQMAEARAHEGRITDVRDLAILELFYSTGMRLSELCGINGSDLDLSRSRSRCAARGRKERILPIGNHAVLALRNYESKRDELLRTAALAASAPPSSSASRGRRIARRSVHDAVTRYLHQVDEDAGSPPTRCATPSPPTSSTPAPTCAPCRSCWATPPWRPRRSTRTRAWSG
jgi:integrase/recombinase XerC